LHRSSQDHNNQIIVIRCTRTDPARRKDPLFFLRIGVTTWSSDTFIFVGKILFRIEKKNLIKYVLFLFVRGDDAGRRGNATDSDGGASATELLTLVAPGSKGGFLKNNLRGAVYSAAYSAAASR